MSDGKTHARASVGMIIFTIILAGLATSSVSMAIDRGLAAGVIIGTILGWLMPPDLDLPQRTEDEHRIINLNPFLGWLWVGFWASYGQMFRHRGLSHVPVLGTITRIFWLFRHIIAYILVTMLFSYVGLITINASIEIQFISIKVLFGILIGWVLQDFVHLALDGVLINFRGPRRKLERAKKKTANYIVLISLVFIAIALFIIIFRY